MHMGVQAEETITDSSTKLSFPKEVSFDYEGKSYKLEATGVATRKKLIIKVYSIAHYLQQEALKSGDDKMQAIMSDDFAKQFTMKWVRDVTSSQQRDGFQESLHKVFTKEQYVQLEKEISTFLNFFSQNAQKGDEYVIRWIPGGHIEVDLNGKKAGIITHKAFAEGVWNIWFGNTGVVNKNDLISLLQ
jgi:hypothetical protein